ncbi:MAG: GNAT family acetyltransferase [Verrucomicrobia bacterium]|jgi:hypothetical protein|nr:GNAT family acetyltransferase [Verrucomicrobiota bacterium]
MVEYDTVQVLDLIEQIGEDEVNEILSDFSCPKNSEIEEFIKTRAVEFSKKKMSMTHLIFDEDVSLVGFYTLTHKPLTVKSDSLSQTMIKKMERHAKYDEKIDSYNLSAFLIAQFGKNYALASERRIAGDRLMNLVYDRLRDVQHEVGGGVIFLECAEEQKLLTFYQKKENGFKPFGERVADGQTRYIQLLRFI